MTATTKTRPPNGATRLMDLAQEHDWDQLSSWGMTGERTPFYRLTMATREQGAIPYCHVVVVWHMEETARLKVSTAVYRLRQGGPWFDLSSLQMIENLIRTGSAKTGP